jgi:hypothetical protein
VRAGGLGAVAVDGQRVFGDLEAALLRDGGWRSSISSSRILPRGRNRGTPGGRGANPVQFEDGLAGLEMVAVQQAGLFELGQHAVDGGQAHIHIVGQQDLVDILGGQVAHFAVLENIQNFQRGSVAFRPLAFRSLGLLPMVATLTVVLLVLVRRQFNVLRRWPQQRCGGARALRQFAMFYILVI